MTTPRHNAHLFKAIADGYLVEKLLSNDRWELAHITDLQDNPNGSFHIPTVSIEARKFLCHAGSGCPYVVTVTRAENDADPRDKWPGFYGWAGEWEAHNMPAHKGPRHPHADMIHAWADGAQMRWQMPDDRTWRYEANGGTPRFSSGYIYEVAPKVVRSRRALVNAPFGCEPTVTVVVEGRDISPTELERAMGADFLSWIDTTWQTHEVPGGAT